MRPGLLYAHLWRAGTVAAVVLPATALAYLSGFAGQPRGWLWMPASLALGAAALAGGLWWRRPGQRVAVVVVVPLAIGLGVATWVRSPPGTGVLAATLDRIELPDSAELLEESSGGNVLCFDVCTTVRRRYLARTDRRPAHVADTMRRSLRAAGLALEHSVGPRTFSTRLEGTELHVTGRVEPSPQRAGVVIRLRAVASG